MRGFIFSRKTLVFMILVGATIVSWGMGHGAGFNDIHLASTSVMTLAFIKMRYIILDFMEVRHAPLLVRRLAEAWVVVVCSALVVLYWIGAGTSS